MFENDDFTQDWLPMSLSVKDRHLLVDRYDASHLIAKVEFFDANVSLLIAFCESEFGPAFLHILTFCSFCKPPSTA